jgi:hypothetical protein
LPVPAPNPLQKEYTTVSDATVVAAAAPTAPDPRSVALSADAESANVAAHTSTTTLKRAVPGFLIVGSPSPTNDGDSVDPECFHIRQKAEAQAIVPLAPGFDRTCPRNGYWHRLGVILMIHSGGNKNIMW